MEEGIGWLGGEDIFANDHECGVCDTNILFSRVSVDRNHLLAVLSYFLGTAEYYCVLAHIDSSAEKVRTHVGDYQSLLVGYGFQLRRKLREFDTIYCLQKGLEYLFLGLDGLLLYAITSPAHLVIAIINKSTLLAIGLVRGKIPPLLRDIVKFPLSRHFPCINRNIDNVFTQRFQ